MSRLATGATRPLRLSLEIFEKRPCLSSSPTAILPTDVDGDGDIDVLYASTGEGMAWLENEDGNGSFSTYENKRFGCGAQSVAAADIDGDGDLDLFCGATGIVVYENTSGKERFVERQNSGFDWHPRIFAADLDTDRDIDLVSSNKWYENSDGKG